MSAARSFQLRQTATSAAAAAAARAPASRASRCSQALRPPRRPRFRRGGGGGSGTRCDGGGGNSKSDSSPSEHENNCSLSDICKRGKEKKHKTMETELLKEAICVPLWTSPTENRTRRYRRCWFIVTGVSADFTYFSCLFRVADCCAVFFFQLIQLSRLIFGERVCLHRYTILVVCPYEHHLRIERSSERKAWCPKITFVLLSAANPQSDAGTSFCLLNRSPVSKWLVCTLSLHLLLVFFLVVWRLALKLLHWLGMRIPCDTIDRCGRLDFETLLPDRSSKYRQRDPRKSAKNCPILRKA